MGKRSRFEVGSLARHMLFASYTSYECAAKALGISKTMLASKIAKNELTLDDILVLSKLTGLELWVHEGCITVQKRHRTFTCHIPEVDAK